MPGKLGDAIFSTPTIRHISKILNTKVDFWTSKYCASLRKLFECQPYINSFNVSESYVAQHDQCGIQPFHMEVPQTDRVYHLGLRSYPQGRLIDYYPELCGFNFVDLSLSFFCQKEEVNPTKKRILVSPGRNLSLKPMFARILEYATDRGYEVIQLGPTDELIPKGPAIECFAEALRYFPGCSLFFGTLSANLVIANGFKCPKIVLCEQERWNPKHDINENHLYVPSDISFESLIDKIPDF